VENGGHVPPSVTIDNSAGGRLAAQALFGSLSENAPSARLLVMPGMDDAPHSQARVRGFQEEVQSQYPGMKVRLLPEGRFDRARAQHVFANFLEDVDLERYAGIFCCNDDMALGVYVAVCEYLKKHERQCRSRSWALTIRLNFVRYRRSIPTGFWLGVSTKRLTPTPCGVRASRLADAGWDRARRRADRSRSV
jgi:hypothetical protein